MAVLKLQFTYPLCLSLVKKKKKSALQNVQLAPESLRVRVNNCPCPLPFRDVSHHTHVMEMLLLTVETLVCFSNIGHLYGYTSTVISKEEKK
jgi:hypothetical protein